MDPRLRSFPIPTSPDRDVCRDYVRGLCKLIPGQCRFRHECTLDEMKSIIQFCHNYQNGADCTLPNCRFLHASKEEQELFDNKGLLPRILQERHAAMDQMHARHTMLHSPMQNIPSMYMTHPPSPPPPINLTAPLPPVMPPPPPPPPPTEAITMTTAPPPIYTAPLQTCLQRIPLKQPPHPLPQKYDPTRPPPMKENLSRKRVYNDFKVPSQTYLQRIPLNQPPPPPPLPRIFDPTKPPPIKENLSRKRVLTDYEAGPSKCSKPDDGKAADNCEKCIQRELSSVLYIEETEKLNIQKEYKKLILKAKADEVDIMKTVMRSILPAEIALAVEEAMDMPMQLRINKLFNDRMPSNSSSNMLDGIQSSSLRTLLYGLCNSTSERTPSPETRPNVLTTDITRTISSTVPTPTNGYNNYTVNGQRLLPTQPPLEPPSLQPVGQRGTYATVASNTGQPYRAMGAGAPVAPAAAPVTFATFQPGVPPPTPVYSALSPNTPGVPPASIPPFSPYAAGSSSQNLSSMPTPAPPPATTTNAHSYSPYMVAGYSQHFYPPYQ